MEFVKQYRWLLLLIIVVMVFSSGTALYAQQTYIEDYDDQGQDDWGQDEQNQGQDDWGQDQKIGQQPPANDDQKTTKQQQESQKTTPSQEPSQEDAPEQEFDQEQIDQDDASEQGQGPSGEYDPDAPQIFIQEYEKEEKIPDTKEDTPYAGACYLNYGFSLSVKGGFRQTFLSGEGRFNDNFLIGTQINFRHDLGLDRMANGYVVGGGMNIYGFRLGFEASHGKFLGSAAINQPVTISGTTYAQGTRLRSNIKFDWFRTTIGYNIYANRYFGIGPAFKIDVIKARYEFKGINQANGLEAKERDSFLFALVNPGIQIDFSFSDPLIFTVAAYGIVFDANSVYFEQFYISLTPRYYLSKSVFIFGEVAYEYFHLKSDRSRDFNGNADVHSWFASAGVGITF